MELHQTDQKQDIGYIKFEKSEAQVINVERFVEKPNLETAKEYLSSGNYLWNAGMFIFDVNNMLDELKSNYSGYNILKDLPNINKPNYKEELSKLYPQCEAISIDYAVMEKSKNIYVVPGDFGWDDIGTWKSLERYRVKDKDENIISGNVTAINSKNNIVYSGDKKIILLDADNIFCIDTDDVLVIGNRESLNRVSDLRNTEKIVS